MVDDYSLQWQKLNISPPPLSLPYPTLGQLFLSGLPKHKALDKSSGLAAVLRTVMVGSVCFHLNWTWSFEGSGLGWFIHGPMVNHDGSLMSASWFHRVNDPGLKDRLPEFWFNITTPSPILSFWKETTQTIKNIVGYKWQAVTKAVTPESYSCPSLE